MDARIVLLLERQMSLVFPKDCLRSKNRMNPHQESSVNFYEILGCPEGASKDDIRKSYKNLALKFHPDKNPDASDGNDQTELFALISKAAETLLDDRSRFKYDSALLQQKNQESSEKIISDELRFEDLYQDDQNRFAHDCRCGGRYVMERSKDGIESKSAIIDCDTCSLSIKILYSKQS